MRSVATEGLDYQEWFHKYAEVHDMEPGDLLHWALNGPHRVANHDTLSVSLTTEHWTRQTECARSNRSSPLHSLGQT